MLKATDSLQYLKPSMGKSNINNNGNGSVTEIIENQALKTISQNKICMIIKEKKMPAVAGEEFEKYTKNEVIRNK